MSAILSNKKVAVHTEVNLTNYLLQNSYTKCFIRYFVKNSVGVGQLDNS